MHSKEKLLRILPGSTVYAAAVRCEMKAWGSDSTLQQKLSTEYSHPAIVAYRNELITGDPHVTWQNLLQSHFGRFERVLSVGVGTGWVEESLIGLGLIESLVVTDLSPSAVEHTVRRLQERNPSIRVSSSVQDVNFIQLEPETYDLVLCHSILHHAINLEHILYQLHASLKVNGVLVVDEFIGPSRWQWSAKTCAHVNSVMRQLVARAD